MKYLILEMVPKFFRTRWPLKRFYWQKEEIERINAKVKEFEGITWE